MTERVDYREYERVVAALQKLDKPVAPEAMIRTVIATSRAYRNELQVIATGLSLADLAIEMLPGIGATVFLPVMNRASGAVRYLTVLDYMPTPEHGTDEREEVRADMVRLKALGYQQQWIHLDQVYASAAHAWLHLAQELEDTRHCAMEDVVDLERQRDAMLRFADEEAARETASTEADEPSASEAPESPSPSNEPLQRRWPRTQPWRSLRR